MGNRGRLHDANRTIARAYAVRRWITCLLTYKDRHRQVMAPNRYTELFFLDEAVSLAAGHRPCAECRHKRYRAFLDAWRSSHGYAPDEPARADEVDKLLHPARIDAHKRKIVFEARLGELPEGTFVELESRPYLVWRGWLFEWTPGGYVRKRALAKDRTVVVLTPKPLVRCLEYGFTVEVHKSASAL